MSIAIERILRPVAGALLLAFASLPPVLAETNPAAGTDLIRSNCGGCHQEHSGKFDRISSIRKTPEGWVMTLFRMRQVHGLTMDDNVRMSIVRYLSDTQGLAPAESAPARFALEQRPNVQDLNMGPEINVVCGRCHSLARVALQRRDEDEWRKLTHTHVGQWPSTEYQQNGRDRHWWDIASSKLPPQLAALYPFSTNAWVEWQKHRIADLAGEWIIVGRVPGGRDFYGAGRIEHGDDGTYSATYRLHDVDGTELTGESKAIVYTGYEWRGSANVGQRARREVYAVSGDGNRIEGRWFYADHPEDGGEWLAVKNGGSAQILAVLPQSMRAGSIMPVTVVGIGIGGTGTVSFGDGVRASNVKQDANFVRADLSIAADASPGLRTVAAGGATGHLAVYRQIDQITVEPAYAIARLGGGRVEPVSAQFRALAFTRLAGGELLPLGPIDSAWSTKPFDAEAARTEDQKYAGYIDRRGRFLPGPAGPNPQREFSGDNVGNLTVVAEARDGDRVVTGRSHLIVTVQRWNSPPIY